jgi:predicted transcriptional regulator of viral defense system
MCLAHKRDLDLAGLAARQHGHVTRRQLLALGWDTDRIGRQLRAGRLIRVHTGVYAVGHLPASPLGGAMAAVLACGPRAWLSHRSAGGLWRMVRALLGPVEVTVPVRRRRPGVVIHQCDRMASADLTVHYGIPITSPARTLYDLAPRLTDAELTRAYNDGKLAGYLRDDDLTEFLGRCASPRLARIIRAGEEPTRSPLEAAFLSFAAEHGLPRPQINVFVCGRRADACFPEQRVVVEIDSVRYHSDAAAF